MACGEVGGSDTRRDVKKKRGEMSRGEAKASKAIAEGRGRGKVGESAEEKRWERGIVEQHRTRHVGANQGVIEVRLAEKMRVWGRRVEAGIEEMRREEMRRVWERRTDRYEKRGKDKRKIGDGREKKRRGEENGGE